MDSAKPVDIDSYIAEFPQEIRERLEQVRATIRKAAPEAEEAISYGIPTFKLNGNLVHFAAFKNHIGFYPAPTGMQEFREELSKYKEGKGSVQFPFDQPLPLPLIARITVFRRGQNLSKPSKKASSKTAGKSTEK